jgi:hypothetical protein
MMPRSQQRRGDPAGGFEERHSRLWLGLVAALAAPALLSPVVLLPMPGGLPMDLYPRVSTAVRVARLAPAFALAASAVTFYAWRRGLEPGHRVAALVLAVLAWLLGISTAGRL